LHIITSYYLKCTDISSSSKKQVQPHLAQCFTDNFINILAVNKTGSILCVRVT